MPDRIKTTNACMGLRATKTVRGFPELFLRLSAGVHCDDGTPSPTSYIITLSYSFQLLLLYLLPEVSISKISLPNWL